MENEYYRPAPHVLDRLAGVTFVAVVGPTAVGKTTLMRQAVKKEQTLHMVLGTTSRTPRPDEQDGIDFHFQTRANVEEWIARGEFVQVAPSVFGDLYGTAPEDYKTDDVSMMAVLADAIPVFRKLPFKTCRTIYVLPPDWETWQKRLVQHNFNADKLALRYAEAQRSLTFAQHDPDVQFVINGDLPAAVEDFVALALQQPLSERLQTDQARAHDLVAVLLEKLDGAMRDPAVAANPQ